LLKRVTDKLLALALLILLSPFWIAIVALMLIDMLFIKVDRGSLLYREKRISSGREFHIYKFRVVKEYFLTSKCPGHARMNELDRNKLTFIGRIMLKRFYLDELPQLLNILKGDMSFVGPRPWPPDLVQCQLKKGIDYRLKITAGLTGINQLHEGRKNKGQKPEHFDFEYIALCKEKSKFSIWLFDLKIILKTFFLLIKGNGLYD
jgi:lipopolysaccharide/colanic/teichoic acid biosynthesis glycosyltransferase